MDYLQRGHFLLSQDRFELAEKEFKKALAEDPNNPFAMAYLAECYLETERRAEALKLAQQALGIEPESSFLFHVLARCYFFNKQTTQAKNIIDEGLKLFPNNPQFFFLKGQIEFYNEEWEAALKEAENGLRLDAENVDLINLRAQALVKLNRQEEAALTLDYALRQAPENSYSHSNKGWVAIEKDQYEDAVTHFKEALRLDPENEYARTGLKEAIKAKNIFYRYTLKYFLWLGKMQEKGRWFFIIGIFILYQIILSVAQNFPSLSAILSPIIVLYILFAFSSWIAMPVSNFFLRFHPLGKHALDKDEMLASNITGLLIVTFLISISAFYLSGNSFAIQPDGLFVSGGEFLFKLAGFSCFMLIPVGGLFGSSAGSKGRKDLTIFTLVIALFGVIGILTNYGWALNLFFIGIFIYSFSANYIIQKGAKEI